MRILHSAPHCHEIGNGVVNVAVDLACKQAELGHTVAFLSNQGSLSGLLSGHGVQHLEVDQESRHPLAVGRALLRLRRVFAEFKPDVVHAHMVPGAVLAWIARAGLRPRLVTTVHNAPQRQAILMGLGDRVIAVSAAVADSMTKKGIPSRKIRVIKNGPLGSPRRHSRTDRQTIGIRRPSITTVARLFKQKGIDTLIDAFAAVSRTVPDATLYLVGEGPERAAFEAQAAASGCFDRIHFVGFAKDPRAYLEQTDIFVLASRADPFPLVIPEAREAGCAIVAAAVDGIPEALEHGEAGILVPPADPPALAAVLTRLLTNSSELSSWRRRAATNIGWLQLDRVNSDTLAVYGEALSRGRSTQYGLSS
jgi:glycosyltransferase involved in cell wall biosynthesis